jgi:CheY-like chemotaxis protein
LAVDDLPANLLAIEAVLEPLGIDIARATSGAQALEMAGEQSFALILLDYMMPGLDGLATLERLRAGPKPNQTPVVLLTAHSFEPELVRKAYALGAFDFVEKPISPEVLRGKVGAFVAMHCATRDLREREAELNTRQRETADSVEALSLALQVLRQKAGAIERISPSDKPVAAAKLVRSVLQLTRTAEQVATHATGKAEEPSITRVSTNASALCSRVLAELEAAYPQVVFEQELTPDVHCSLDEGCIEQLLEILVANAAAEKWVAVALRQAGELVEIVVRDRGPAIPKWALRSLLAPVSVGGWVGHRKALRTVRSIARAHGGDVQVTSNDAVTEFVVRLAP